MKRDEIVAWLRENNEARLAELWRRADDVRQRHVGGEVHLRGLIEFSNYCVRLCAYCGLRAPNAGLTRYRMSADEILACARQAVAVRLRHGGAPVGRGPGHRRPMDGRPGPADQGRDAAGGDAQPGRADRRGAGRLARGRGRSLPAAVRDLEPRRSTTGSTRRGRAATSDRLAMLRRLRELGYEVGSGVMIGIPGQTYDDLARDIELFGELDLDMIGVGPVPGPSRHAAGRSGLPARWCRTATRCPANELMTYKVIALARLVCPRANIPSTTALATLNTRSGRELGLVRGANMVMPNLTPAEVPRPLRDLSQQGLHPRDGRRTATRCLQARIASPRPRASARGRGDSPELPQDRRARAVRASVIRTTRKRTDVLGMPILDETERQRGYDFIDEPCLRRPAAAQGRRRPRSAT